MTTITLDSRPLDTVDGMNLIINPSGRRGTTGYTVAGGTISADPGNKTSVVATGSPAAGALTLTFGSTGIPSVVIGNTYTLSADIQSVGCSSQLKVSGAIVGGSVLSAVQAAGGAMARVSVTFVPLGIGTITVAVVNAVSATAGQSVSFRDARIGDDATYFDGLTPADAFHIYRWQGTADNSHTERLGKDPDTEPISPTLILGYETSRAIRSVAHKLLSSPENVVTLRPAALRAGTIRYLFDTAATAHLAERFHAEPSTITLDDPDAFGEMQYLPTGASTLALDPDTRTMWTLTVDFQEVSEAVVVPL
ncbi:hypothetical protein QMG83_14530 [Salinibacterium sp. G-O1]|uniref:hypothetical protein n=1 Tax=Salinibacterium sp. G-O1 TaxID=3046208 RepID=UPI0024BA7832|nr:hypothetical protein [Salinibacterium sp. G-O1]MDJ0336440.1 hypothetical protein [Salinibacterium sp. G-O1]